MNRRGFFGALTALFVGRKAIDHPLPSPLCSPVLVSGATMVVLSDAEMASLVARKDEWFFVH